MILQYILFLLVNQVVGECGYGSCPTPLPGYINVHLVPHTHDDVGWLKTVDQYFYGNRNDIQRAGVQYIIDSVVQQLLQDPSKRFIYVESAFFWRWWNQQTQDMKNNVKQLVNDGRLEFISGGWSMNDEAAAHYSAIIDNMALGIRFLQEEFGDCGRPKIGWQIDPFGHSREYANILAKFGYDGLFLGRIDYDDKNRRLKEKNMEMIWTAGEGGEEGRIFTGINYNGYGPPPGFCFDTLCTDVIMDDERLEDYNLDEKLASFINLTREQAASYKSDNIMMTMGSDFQYQEANMWYKNLDKLIKYMNEKKEDTKINLMYSTPSCYLKSVKDSKVPLPSKNDDFFPYASDPHAYWTGYFTSRPALKGMIRKTNSVLQACKQVESATVTTDTDPRVTVAKMSVAVNQHHDAVTGTAKQHVTDDYYLALHRGLEACHQVIGDGVKASHATQCNFQDWCPFLNVSQCEFTESRDSFSMAVYNQMPRTETFFIRIPIVQSNQYQVKDEQGADVSYQILPIPASVQTVPGRQSKAKFELLVKADVAGLSSQVYQVKKLAVPYADTTTLSLSSGRFTGLEVKQEDGISLQLSRNGGIRKIKSAAGDINLHMGFHWYTPAVGDNSADTKRASGAYVFRPNGTSTTSIGDPVEAKVYKGELVDEVHQVYNDWISQIIRMYKGRNVLEFEWMVGPVPIKDGGKEVIARYSSDLESGKLFETDSNGRGSIGRQRDHRDTWNLNLTEPISANYYPVDSKIGISGSGGQQMWVLPDRSEGGASLAAGEVELMVHRRLLNDDSFGVGEALNESAYDHGLVVRGTHVVLLCDKNCEDDSSVEAERVFAKPVILFGEACQQTRMEKDETSNPMELPYYIKVLTREKLQKSKVLVRVENLSSKDDQSFSLHMPDLFQGQKVTSIQEMTLDGNVAKSKIRRFSWTPESNEIPSAWDELNRNAVKTGEEKYEDMDVNIPPGFIKTYLVSF